MSRAVARMALQCKGRVACQVGQEGKEHWVIWCGKAWGESSQRRDPGNEVRLFLLRLDTHEALKGQLQAGNPTRH